MASVLHRLRRLAAVARHLRFDTRPLRSRPITAISTDQADAAGAVRWLGPVDVGGDARHALFCHPHSVVSFELPVQAGDRVAAWCALMPDVWDRNTDGVAFSIEVTAAGSTSRATVVVNPRRARDRAWRHLDVAVPRADANATVRLATSTPTGGSAAYGWAIWGEPSLQQRRPSAEVGAAVRQLLSAARRSGVKAALVAAYANAATDAERRRYRAWTARRAESDAGVRRMTDAASRFRWQPLVSILTPVHNTPSDLLRRCIASVQDQAYPHWELCLADDASSRTETLDVLASARADPRVRVVRLEQSGGISKATNAALHAATGEFIALLDHDDEITPDALFAMVERLNGSPDIDVLYSDEDKLDEDGGVSEPYFKPDWSPDHILSAMYTCHLTMARRQLVLDVGGFRPRCDGAQDHDLILRMSDRTDRIVHVPRVLYHWRRAAGSMASTAAAKPWAEDAGRRAIEDHLERNGLGHEVLSGGLPGVYRPKFDIRGEPRVLVIVIGDPSAARGFIDRMGVATTSSGCEVVSTTADTMSISAAARQTTADHLVFVDAGLDMITADWLSVLLEYSQQDGIGAVGGKTQYADGRLRHIGLIVGAGTGVDRAMHGYPASSYGYFSSALGVRNYSAVSGEWLMTRRVVWQQLGGFDEALPWNGADVDYCLKARATGRRIVFTPAAQAKFRAEAVPRPDAPDALTINVLRARHPDVFGCDPYYNPNLSRRDANYELEQDR